MGWFQRFWKELTTAFNPSRYDTLHQGLGKSFRYYLMMVLLFFIITTLLFIPALFKVPSSIDEEMSKFDSLALTFDYTLKEPISIPENNPVLVIDTIDNPNPITEGTFIVTGDALQYKSFPFGQRNIIRNDDNILEKPEEVESLLLMLVLMGLPFLIITAYVYFAAKYLILIFIASFLGFILARVARFEIEYANLFRMGLHASTVMVALGLLTKPFIPSIGYLEYIVFAIFFVLGAIKLGEFEQDHHEQPKDPYENSFQRHIPRERFNKFDEKEE